MRIAGISEGEAAWCMRTDCMRTDCILQQTQAVRTRRAAHLAAEAEAEAAATASAHAVLFSLDLWVVLWPSLDHDSKVALRGVSSAMRRQVDAFIEVVASPASGFSPDALTAALLRWPAVHHLTLLAVGGASDLAPLATASLSGLTSLTVRQVGAAHGARTAVAWRSCCAHACRPPACMQLLR
jgi:hypothetical protein